MKLRLRRPGDMARLLRTAARRRPEEVEDYLDEHVEEWTALAEVSPGDAADILEALGEGAASDLIAELDADDVAEVLTELHDHLAADILEDLPAQAAADVLAEMLPEEAADVLAAVENEEDAERLLDLMPAAAAAEIRQILEYAPDSAGGLMTTDIAMLPIGLTTAEAIERIRELNEELESLSYVYIVDQDGRLRGVLSFRELVFNPPSAGLNDVMIENPISVGTDTDREIVADLMRRYHLSGIPVVDPSGVLVGMVTSDTALEAVQLEASEDFAMAVGAGSDETTRTPLSQSIRARLPWIGLDVFVSASVVFAVSRFQGILASITVLAALMPLIARVGGDSGAQSLAVVIRGLASDEIQGASSLRVIRREGAIGAINGVVIALLAGSLGFALQTVTGGEQPLRIGLVMAIATFANMTVAGLAGAGIPLALRRLRLDPALGSNLFLTTITDLIGFGGFLAVASALL